jgi:Flp pilus assembly pilin Flp
MELKQKKSTLGKDERGAAAIETALFFPIFIIFFIGILEIGLVAFGNSVIKNQLSQAARESMVGCLDSEDNANGLCNNANTVIESRLRTRITRLSAGLVDASTAAGRLTFTADRANCLTFIDDPNGYRLPNPAQRGRVSLGQPKQIMIFNIMYRWPLFFPGISMYYAGIFGSEPLFSHTIIVRNENFAVPLDTQFASGRGDARRGLSQCGN